MSSVEQKVVGKQLSNSFQQLHSVFERPLAVAVNIELSNYMKYNSTHKYNYIGLGLCTTSVTPQRFIEVLVPSPESERSCICMLGLSNLPLTTILGWILELLRQCDIFCFSFY